MRFNQLSGMSDNALLEAYANGIPGASQILTDRFMSKIFTQAFHRVRNEADADDIAQEAMLRLWRIAPNWNQGNAKISTWLAAQNIEPTRDALIEGGRELRRQGGAGILAKHL